MSTQATAYPQSRNPNGRPKSHAKRAAILDAATSLFFKQGYDRISLDLIADTAQVSKLTIYNHFENKEGLFAAVIRARCDLEDQFNLSRYADLEPRLGLEIIGLELTKSFMSPGSIEFSRVLFAEALRDVNVARLYYEAGPDRVRRAFVEVLRRWGTNGVLQIRDYEVAAGEFFSLIKGELHTRALLGFEVKTDPAALRKHVRAGVRMFLDRYGAAAPTTSHS